MWCLEVGTATTKTLNVGLDLELPRQWGLGGIACLLLAACRRKYSRGNSLFLKETRVIVYKTPDSRSNDAKVKNASGAKMKPRAWPGKHGMKR